jgi:2-keto-4-pentenoate hydratase/2-oxohepta-3-ene-1,7-dioic acid hydratase in catechol pathway
MRLATIRHGNRKGLALKEAEGLRVLLEGDDDYPGNLEDIVRAGPTALDALAITLSRNGKVLDDAELTFEPPLRDVSKIICVGLNYFDHTNESGFAQPDYPTLFARFPSSLIGQDAPLFLPRLSEQFDYEGELAVVIGKGGRSISKVSALDHVLGYAVFNDASLRDYQFKSPQWTAGKNFDGTGAFGPFLVTADELPPGCKGLTLETRLNGVSVQKARIDEMVFDVATLIETLSAFMTLEPGDIIVSGTPAGVGMGRKPPLWMKPGDRVEVEIEQVGLLRNAVVAE